ncbi:nuclear transport factor 2 family protein [Pseudonocardia acidicola]|uniref:Nuclear transport factor 2 family protein n=1 Tax=Pseudonocardia acidicola TaxID=2724939 RepID=A0ABX1SD95_9PSEU|nr:nuclear transport factor 2 family protein [Pseudonocardia acidicola]NMH98239.1 nuclear transport factor 2 family protein [Pseudonocardia acidicola]
MTEILSPAAPDTLPQVVRDFLQAVAGRDANAVARCFTPDARYFLAMPHPAVEGREKLQAVFERVLGEADRVRWDIVTSSVDGDLVFLERVDRFWFGENEAPIECVGVLRLADGLIAEIRDYADLGAWKERKAAATGAPSEG